MADEQCTVIVTYEVTAEDCDKFMNAWKRAQDYLKEQPGFISTRLHKADSASPDFRFVNIGCWQSVNEFRAATQSNGFREAAGWLEAYPIHAAVYHGVET